MNPLVLLVLHVSWGGSILGSTLALLALRVLLAHRHMLLTSVANNTELGTILDRYCKHHHDNDFVFLGPRTTAGGI